GKLTAADVIREAGSDDETVTGVRDSGREAERDPPRTMQGSNMDGALRALGREFGGQVGGCDQIAVRVADARKRAEATRSHRATVIECWPAHAEATGGM